MKNQTTKNIFKVLGRILETGELIFSRETLMSKLNKLSVLEAEDRRYVNQTVRRATKRKLIDIREKKGKIFYRVTPLGARKINEHKLKELKIPRSDWDGYWRVIIFDIPETKKQGRDALRERLKYFGFYPLQKSVFVCPFKCEKELKVLGDFYDIFENIEIFLTRSVGRKEQEIKDFFGI